MSEDRVITRIGNVARLLRGVTYKKEEASDHPTEGLVPLLRATNINRQIDFAELVHVPEGRVDAQQYLQPGDSVLAASSGSLSVVGKSAPVRREWKGTFGAFCYALRPLPDRIAAFYLSYFLQTSEYRSQVARLAAGVNINNLKREHLEDFEIPLRPLAEQHRIVEAIESYFTRLDDATATLERVQHNLKRYRASVLKAAVEGRLVPTEAELARAEGRDYEPASVLLERILAERRRRWEANELVRLTANSKMPQGTYEEPATPKPNWSAELPEGWCWATVEQLASDRSRSIQSGPFGSNLRHSEFQPTGKLVIGIDNVQDGFFSMGSENRISETKFLALEKYSARPGDVLVTVMATIGRCCVVPQDIEPAIITKHVYRISVDNQLVSPHYLHRALWGGPTVREQMFRKAQGQTRPGLNGAIIRQLCIPLPPRCEQDRIVAEVDRLLSIRDESATALALSQQRCDRLRQSILKWAFEGRLVDQDPADEPASVLLERIKAERAATTTSNKKPRRKRKSANA